MSFLERSKHYFTRVIHNDSTKRGMAAAAAGLVMSLVIEAAWPTARLG